MCRVESPAFLILMCDLEHAKKTGTLTSADDSALV